MASEPRCARHPLAPAIAPCMRCGTFACPDCLAADGQGWCRDCAARAEQANLPPLWERQADAGVNPVLAFGQTVVDVFTAPRRFFREVRQGQSVGWPLAFAVALQFVELLFDLGHAARLLTGGSADSETVRAAAWNLVKVGAGMFAFAPIRVFLLAAVLTVSAVLVGLRVPFVRTARAMAYVSATGVLGVLPLVGGPLSVLALLVLGVIAFATVHETTLRRAAVVIALPAIGSVFCFVGVYQLFAGRSVGG
jgi:hypothetical protein